MTQGEPGVPALILLIGVLRLRFCFAARSSHSAQDDTYNQLRAEISGRSKSSIVSRRRITFADLPSISTSAAFSREL
jgi:hypothetical protein